MKVSELIQKLSSMDPDIEARVLVTEDGNLKVYGKDVVSTSVTRMTEVGEDLEKVWSLDVYCYEEERENGTL